MDRYSYEAYGRIRIFLADLSLLLGQSLPYMSPSGTLGGPQPTFNNIGLPQHLSQPNSWQRSSRNQPTQQSKAWKKQHANHTPEQVMTCPQPHNYNTTSPIISTNLPMTTLVSVEPALISAPAEDTLERGENDDQDYAIEDPEAVSQHQDDLEIQSEQSDLADNVPPEASEIDEMELATGITGQPEFDINNYSTHDMQSWASTLSPDEFDCLCHVNNKTPIDCFRQYIFANLDQQNVTQLSQPEPLDHQEQPAYGDDRDTGTIYSVDDQQDSGTNPDQFNHEDGGFAALDDASGGFDDFGNDHGSYEEVEDGGGYVDLDGGNSGGGSDDLDSGGGGFNDFGHDNDGPNDWDGGTGFDGLDDTADYGFEY